MAEQPQVNKSIIDPDLDILLQDLKTDIFRSFNCIQIGRIETFNATNQTAKIQLLIKRIINPQTQESRSYPVLVDCPVFISGNQTSYLSFPINPGDECIVLFNDRNIDNWFFTGDEGLPADFRVHDLSDGIALVGIRSLVKSIAGLNNNQVTLKTDKDLSIESKDAVIAMVGSLINLSNASENNKSILQDFIDVLTSATQPDTSPVFSPASITALNIIKTRIGTLFS